MSAPAKPVRVRETEARYTPDEAAALMRVTKETILRPIRTGDLVAKKLGKGYRIKASDLDRWYDGLDDVV